MKYRPMRILAVALITLNLFSGNALTAQTSDPITSISGAWVFDQNLSSKHESISRIDEMRYVISQNGAILKVQRTITAGKKSRVQGLTYFTDGRGEKNPTIFGGEKRKSKTSVTDGKVISKYTLSWWASSTNEYYKQPAQDTWEVSKNGQTLTITTESGEIRNLPEFLRTIFKTEKYQKVFRRVDPRND